MKNISKKQMADKLGYEYIGKGFDDSCDDGFIIRECGTTNHTNIGTTMEQATEWLEDRYNILLSSEERKTELQLLVGLEGNMSKVSKEFVKLGYSDMFDIGNIDECIENNKGVAISIFNEITREYEEIDVQFDIIKLCNREEYENSTDTVVKITGVFDI